MSLDLFIDFVWIIYIYISYLEYFVYVCVCVYFVYNISIHILLNASISFLTPNIVDSY